MAAALAPPASCGARAGFAILQTKPEETRVALKNVIGVDHAVVMAKDLDKATQAWRSLGFTVSPRGTHSAHMGTGNYTIMLDPDYIELLGVIVPTEYNAPTRGFLDKRGDGIERIAFTAIDSAAG